MSKNVQDNPYKKYWNIAKSLLDQFKEYWKVCDPAQRYSIAVLIIFSLLIIISLLVNPWCI